MRLFTSLLKELNTLRESFGLCVQPLSDVRKVASFVPRSIPSFGEKKDMPILFMSEANNYKIEHPAVISHLSLKRHACANSASLYGRSVSPQNTLFCLVIFLSYINFGLTNAGCHIRLKVFPFLLLLIFIVDFLKLRNYNFRTYINCKIVFFILNRTLLQ